MRFNQPVVHAFLPSLENAQDIALAISGVNAKHGVDRLRQRPDGQRAHIPIRKRGDGQRPKATHAARAGQLVESACHPWQYRVRKIAARERDAIVWRGCYRLVAVNARAALVPLLKGLSFGADLRANIGLFLLAHDRADTLGHCARVAAGAGRIAERFGLEHSAAETAGWLHDISAVIQNDMRIQVAEGIGLTVLDAERAYPMIVHQRLSEAMATALFDVHDAASLSAIGCHTTLKANASALDKAVFVADKIKWDQAGDPPYLGEILAALNVSLDAAAFCYLDYLFQRRGQLKVVHPWAWDAYIGLNTEEKHGRYPPSALA